MRGMGADHLPRVAGQQTMLSQRCEGILRSVSSRAPALRAAAICRSAGLRRQKAASGPKVVVPLRSPWWGLADHLLPFIPMRCIS